jgi:hypothetical protein
MMEMLFSKYLSSTNAGPSSDAEVVSVGKCNGGVKGCKFISMPKPINESSCYNCSSYSILISFIDIIGFNIYVCIALLFGFFSKLFPLSITFVRAGIAQSV